MRATLYLRLWLSGVIILSSSALWGQSFGVDSRNKDVFNFYKTSSFSIPVSSVKGSIKFNATFKSGKTTQYFIDKDGGDGIFKDLTSKQYRVSDSLNKLTMVGSHGFNVAVELGQIKANLAKFATFHPTIGVTFGYGKNLDLVNNWDNFNKLRIFSPFLWSVSVNLKRENSQVYDTVNKTAEWRFPVAAGILTESAFFPFNWMIVSSSLSYEYGSNVGDMKDFQTYPPLYSDASIVAVGDLSGKIGRVERLHNIRARLSFPLFLWPTERSRTTQPCIIPYFALYGSVGRQFTQMYGVFASMLGDKFAGKKNGALVAGAGIGADWYHNRDGWSDIAVTISGSLDLHKVIQAVTSGKQAKKKRA